MKFGTDGIRGIAGPNPIDPDTGVGMGRSAARLARAHGGAVVAVARDTRPSGAMLASSVLAGIAGEGCVAIDLGVLPTPGLAVALQEGLATTGVMVTASHNVWSDNGFKLLGPQGRKLTADETAHIEATFHDEHCGGVGYLQTADGRPSWLKRLQSLGLDVLSGQRIAFDLAEGAATTAREFLSNCGIEAVFVEGDRINDGVGSEHPERLQRLVVEAKCRAGIAVDGDADRCLLVDERGRVLHGDAVTWMLARSMKVSSLAVTQMSTAALKPALPGVVVHVTPVGDKHLQVAMREHDLPLAAEESGHILFSDHPGGDGLFAGLRLLTTLQGSLAETADEFVPWPRVKSKIRVEERVPLDGLDAVTVIVREGEARLGEGGRVFLRYSGTEPVLRVLVEGREQTEVEAVARDVEAVLRELLCPE